MDADVLDDAVMPAVDYRQPGGLSPGELATVLAAALATGRVAGVEVTIYNPALDHDGNAGVVVTRALVNGRDRKTGTYTVSVRDRSRLHNAHVVAPGYNRKTTLPFVGTQTWRIALARTGKLRFLCDPHASSGMRGSAKIVR